MATLDFIGGSCGSGALSGAVGSALSPLTMKVFPNAQGDLGDRIGGTIVSATAGGLASIAGGGRFENGAITAAFGYLFNAEAPKRCDALCQAERNSALRADAIQPADDVLLLGVGGGLGVARAITRSLAAQAAKEIGAVVGDEATYSTWNATGGLKGINTNVTAGEFVANLRSSGLHRNDYDGIKWPSDDTSKRTRIYIFDLLENEYRCECGSIFWT